MHIRAQSTWSTARSSLQIQIGRLSLLAALDRAIEAYPQDRYGMDFDVFMPRICAVVPREVAVKLERARINYAISFFGTQS